MDYFSEKIVEKQMTFTEMMLKGLLFFAGGIVALTAALLLPKFNSINIIIAGGIIYIVYFASKYFGIEYEYTVTNSDLDVDKIIAKRRRKRVLSANFKEISILAPTTDNSYKTINKADFKKIYDVTSGKSIEDIYFCIFENNEFGKCLLTFEPNEKMLDIFGTLMQKKFIRG